MQIKTNLLFILVIVFVFSACSQSGQQTNMQNIQPSPLVSATIAPTVSVAANENPANSGNTEVKNANQIVQPTPKISPTPKPTATLTVAPNDNSVSKSKYKNYTVRGVVKKIDAANNSIIIDHEDIADYMVAMEMPFPVVNRKILDGIKVGDKITFVLETGVGVERIISIRKN